jgi:hypothetical protein
VLAGAETARPARVRFVVVDDSGGSDPAVEAVSSLPDVRVATPPFNLGHQRALVYGLRLLRPEVSASDVVVTMDADGEDRPEDLPRLLEALLGEPGGTRTVVLARRTSRHVTPAFKVLYFFFRILFQSMTGLVIRTGNFAAYRGWVVTQVLDHPHFDLCYSSSLISLNLDVRYVPCARGLRYAGTSRMGYLKLIRHGTSMLMPFLDRIAVRALVGFSAVFGLGLAASLIAAGLAVFGRGPLPGWAAALVASTVVLSVLALGNFVILFAVYAQSQSQALSALDRTARLGASAPGVAAPAQAEAARGDDERRPASAAAGSSSSTSAGSR